MLGLDGLEMGWVRVRGRVTDRVRGSDRVGIMVRVRGRVTDRVRS